MTLLIRVRQPVEFSWFFSPPPLHLGELTDLLAKLLQIYFGLRLANAFAPVLATNGGGTLLNILSAAAWISVPTGYAASKAAMWSATNALRVALKSQQTQVIGLLVGMVDTPMAARWDVPKVSAVSVVDKAYEGVANGAIEILADEAAHELKSRLSMKGEELYPWMDEQLRGFVP